MASREILDAIGAAGGALANQVAGARSEDNGKINGLNFRLQGVEAYIQNVTAKSSDENMMPMTALRAFESFSKYTCSSKENGS